MRETVQTHLINGTTCYTVSDFASIVHKDKNTIRGYIKIGNKIRKLKAIKLGTQWFIPIDEVREFPFTLCGRNNQENTIYHYDESGKIKV